MKPIIVATLSLLLATPAFAQTATARVNPAATGKGSSPEEMTIARAGSQASIKGPAQNFTGTVRIDPVFGAHPPVTTSAGAVTFEPGARTAWHTHPAGQVLVVTSGAGRIAQWGGKIEEIRPGDVIWTPPGVKHWHGAAPTTAMTHMAIQDMAGGKNVDWMEKVSDEQYGQ
jgi:quercetin dioxygenase-like cupin family protein